MGGPEHPCSGNMSVFSVTTDIGWRHNSITSVDINWKLRLNHSTFTHRLFNETTNCSLRINCSQSKIQLLSPLNKLMQCELHTWCCRGLCSSLWGRRDPPMPALLSFLPFGAFAKLRKDAVLLTSCLPGFCVSVRPHRTIWLSLDRFTLNFF